MRHPSEIRAAATTFALAVLAALCLAPAAMADPDITLEKRAPSSVLYGEDSTVTLHVDNPTGEPYGYNLTLRDVLPPGVSYVPGSSAAVAPTVIPNAPGPGQTTLIFENVTDLSPNSSYDLSYDVAHDTAQLTPGETYTNQADAYINTDPRFVPDFDPVTGQPTGDFTDSATDSAVTLVNAIEILKDEPSPEGEILRGVHDHQTVYTLTVRNNLVEPTDTIEVEDWLPAGLEFLGCGTEDNTTDAPTNPAASPEEYAGSGAIDPGNAPAVPLCVAPDLVETVQTDPDGPGPMPNDVYTHVVWNDVGDLAASAEIELEYVAAIPIRENTTTWVGVFPPDPASGDQTANLDNNSGSETADEQALTNFATATGLFEGTTPVTDDTTLTRTAEDLRVLKSVDLATISQGQISEWTLDIATSEYRYVDDVRVTDTLPDGLCPLGTTNLEGGGDQQSECDPVGGELPDPAYTSATESADGTWTLVWNQTTVPELQRMQPSSGVQITFPTRTRTDYQENFQADSPVLAHDAWENGVAIAGADFRICAPADPDCTGGGATIDGDEAGGSDDLDTSAARQEAGALTIDKKVRENAPLPVDCDTGTYVDNPPLPVYGPGDEVCWELRIDFAAVLDAGNPRLTDFLPPGTQYVPGSAAPTADNTVPSAFSDADAANGRLTWDLGTAVDSGSLVFEWRLRTRVLQGVSDAEGDVAGNLMKLSFENSESQSFPLRDRVEFERTQARLDLVKGVADVDGAPGGGNPPDTDGATVAEDDVVTFRVDLTNDGDLAAEDAVVWDELEDGITCADVSGVSDGGNCAGTRITWTGVGVAAGATHTLTYDVEIPDGVEPGRRFDDRAGVVSYTSDTNGGGSFTYVPEDNIDPGAPPANAQAADDTSFVVTPVVTFSKTRTTSVTAGGNNLASQATIGETIEYTATVVVPEGTTLYGSPQFTDALGTRQTYVTPPAATATLNGGALPGGFSLGVAGNTVTLDFPATYTNAAGSGDDTFAVTFSATVDDEAANGRVAPNQTLTNTADFDWEQQDGTPVNREATVDTTIVEPNVVIAKDENDADDEVQPGDPVTYTLSLTNPTAPGRVSTAYDVEVVDHVPAGLTPDLPIPDSGVWDSGAGTITWTIAAIAPGAAAVQRSYTVTVDDPATAGSIFTNTADATATSLAGAVAGERTAGTGYSSTAQDTVGLGDAILTKSVAPGEATIGQLVTYTTEVVFPGGINYFDAAVIDTLPDGLVYVDTVSVACDVMPCSPAVTELPPQPQGNGTTRLGWYLDDLASQPAARTYTITYTAVVADTYTAGGGDVLDGQTLTNTAAAYYRGASIIAGVPLATPDPADYSDGSDPDTAALDVVEPEVAIDKRVSGDGDLDDARATVPGDGYTYSLIVSNPGTAPAHDVEVIDTPDETRLENIAPAANPNATITDADGTDGTVGWTIGTIPAGGSVTLTYTADLVPSAALSDGDTVVNTADVARFWGIAAAERGANPGRDFREYTVVPADAVTLTVDLPTLVVEKTTGGAGFPESAVAEIGEPFPWRVVIRNTATAATAESVDVEDTLPAGWSYVPGSASFAPGGAAAPAIAGQVLTWTDVGDIAPGGQIVLTFQAVPAPGTTPGANLNAAEAAGEDVSGAGSSADGPYADGDTAEAVVTLPVLELTKTPDAGSVDAGDDATYTILVENTGTVPARDVEVTDVLGADQAYAAGTATALPAAGFSETSVTAGPGVGETTIDWAIDEIGPGGTVTITLPAQTESSLAAATGLVNDASVVSREVLVPVDDAGGYASAVDSDVEIVKTAQVAAVDAGDEMDFTLTVTNHGPSDAAGVEVQDTLPANLTFVSADAPCLHAAGVVTCAVGDLAAGASVALDLRVEIDPNETVGVSNTATVASTTPDSDNTNNSSTASKPVGVLANVAVEKGGPAAPVLQGTTFDYVIRVANDGVSAAVDVELSDPLPAGVTFQSVATTAGACVDNAGTIECDLGTMQPDDEITVTVTVLAVDVGAPVNTATATTPSAESSLADNDDDHTVTVLPAADLAVTKTAPPAVAAGGLVAYTLEAVNNGPSDATGVTLTDTLPAGVEFVSADAGCSEAAGIVTCAVGALADAATATYTVTVRAPFALGDQTLTNAVVIDGNEGDLVAANDTDQAATTVGPSADLAIAKTAGAATAGATAMWTIVVQNRGPSAASPVEVVDALPAGTGFVSATPSQGSCAAAGAGIACGLGSIASGAAAQIVVVSSVPTGTAGRELRNTATVSAPQPDPNPGDNSAEAVSVIQPPPPGLPNLTLEKTASTARPQLGRPFTYRMTVRNSGGLEAKDVRLTDTLSAALVVRRMTPSQGSCALRGAQVTCKVGTLAPGGTASVLLRVVPVRPGAISNTASVMSTAAADLVPADNGDVAGVKVSAPRATWRLTKRASRSSLRGGETVRFTIRIRTGARAVARATVCDRLPEGLVFVRVRGARFRNGRACWTLPYLGPRTTRTLRMTARAERGFVTRSVRSRAVADARNAVRRAAGAQVQIHPAFEGAGGGVTG